MKKIFMVFALVITLGLFSCGNAQKETKVEEPTVTTTEVDTVNSEEEVTNTDDVKEVKE